MPYVPRVLVVTASAVITEHRYDDYSSLKRKKGTWSILDEYRGTHRVEFCEFAR